MLNFNDGLPAIIQPDHATIKSRDRTHLANQRKETKQHCNNEIVSDHRSPP